VRFGVARKLPCLPIEASFARAECSCGLKIYDAGAERSIHGLIDRVPRRGPGGGSSEDSVVSMGTETQLENSIVDKRRSPRFGTKFDALVSATQEEGAGVLGEISYSGARLEDTSMRPEIGSVVTLYIFVQPVSPFELKGHVIRHTDTGFAITYELFDVETRQLVDDVSALVSDPRTR
jgi:hypothetical protein